MTVEYYIRLEVDTGFRQENDRQYLLSQQFICQKRTCSQDITGWANRKLGDGSVYQYSVSPEATTTSCVNARTVFQPSRLCSNLCCNGGHSNPGCCFGSAGSAIARPHRTRRVGRHHLFADIAGSDRGTGASSERRIRSE